MGDRFKIDPAYRQRLNEAGLDGVGRVLQRLSVEGVAGEGETSQSQCVRTGEPGGSHCVRFDVNGHRQYPALSVKCFRYPTLRVRLNFLGRCFFGRSRAKREFRRLRIMRKLGIQSARPLALGERRCWGLLTDCFLVTEGVPASDSLRDFAVRYFHKAASPRGRELKRAMMAQLADQIRQMHDKHFFHGELTWDNILIRPTPSGAFEFFFINALRGRRVLAPWKWRRLGGRDLAGIDAVPDEFLTRADKIRFMNRYLQRDELNAKDRDWMIQIRKISLELFASLSTYRSARPADRPSPDSQQVQPSVHH